jgi:hypothetical protein
MALSHDMVAQDVEHIEAIARGFGNVEVALCTNKRIVLWCPEHYTAKNLAINLRREGYHYEIKQGLKSSAWYVQAYYH